MALSHFRCGCTLRPRGSHPHCSVSLPGQQPSGSVPPPAVVSFGLSQERLQLMNLGTKEIAPKWLKFRFAVCQQTTSSYIFKLLKDGLQWSKFISRQQHSLFPLRSTMGDFDNFKIDGFFWL